MTRTKNQSKMKIIISTTLFIFAFSSLAYAKTTSDPNHQGWTGKKHAPTPAEWKPIWTKCQYCEKISAQYNHTIKQLLKTRFDLQTREFAYRKFENFANDRTLELKLIYRNRGLAELSNDDLEEIESLKKKLRSHESGIASLKEYITILEKQAKNLMWAVQECERTACKIKKSKMKDIKVGGELTSDNFQPDINKIFSQYNINWNGPYSTKCEPCRQIVRTLNHFPGWITRAHFYVIAAQQELDIAEGFALVDKSRVDADTAARNIVKLKDKVSQEKANVKQLVDTYRQLQEKLPICLKKYCPEPKEKKIGYLPDDGQDTSAIALSDAFETCPAQPAHEPITVGANADIGSSADFNAKAKGKALGAVTGMASKLLGIGGGGGGGKSEGPVTYKDPVKNKYKEKFRNKELKRELIAGAVFTTDGLTVSTDIKKAPGKGTFQTIYLENPRGWRIMPIGYYLYEIWAEWKLSVSWTKDTYVNDEHVKHEEGGWSDSWKELVARGEEAVFGEVSDEPVWRQMGFNTAVSGVRAIGTSFPVSPEMLHNEPINLVIHVTDPKKDPVVTHPYVMRLSLNEKGVVIIEEMDQTLAMENDVCTQPKTALTEVDSIPVTDHLQDPPGTGAEADDLADAQMPPMNADTDVDLESIRSLLDRSRMNYPHDLYGLYKPDGNFAQSLDELQQLIDFDDPQPGNTLKDVGYVEDVGPSTRIDVQVRSIFGHEPPRGVDASSERMPDYEKPEFAHRNLDENSIVDIWTSGLPVGDEPLTAEQQAHFNRIYQKRKVAKTTLANSDHETRKTRVRELRIQKTELELDLVTLDDDQVGSQAEQKLKNKLKETEDLIEDNLRKIDNIEKWVDHINNQAEIELESLPANELWREEFKKYETLKDAEAKAEAEKNTLDPKRVKDDVQGAVKLS